LVELINLKYAFNLNYFKEEEISGKKFFLKQIKDQLIFEIKTSENLVESRMVFVNKKNDFIFTSFEDTRFKLGFMGKFSMSNSNEFYISPDGNIAGNPLWSFFKVIRYGAISRDGVSYTLISLISADQAKNDFAVRIDKDSVTFYSYNALDQGKYKIELLKRADYVFSKVH